MSRGRYDLLNPCPICKRQGAMADQGHAICRQCEGVEPKARPGGPDELDTQPQPKESSK